MNLANAMLVTTVPVTDLDRARQFYAETLGLRLLFEAGPSIRFEAGGAWFRDPDLNILGLREG